MKICQRCGEYFEGDACPRCGSKIYEVGFSYICMKCGEEVVLSPTMVTACTKCGSKILLKKRPNVIKRVKAR